MRRILRALLALLLFAALAACSASSSSGGNRPTGGGAPSMECMPGIDCPGDSHAGGGGPVASADAAPRGGASGCFLHSLNGVGVVGDDVEGSFTVTCQVPATMMLITARLQMKNSAGNWVDETPLYVYHAPAAGQPLPEVGVPQDHPVAPGKLQAHCVTGTWRLEGHWAGIKGNGRPFPNPADGDTPADWASAPAYFQC